MRWIKHSCYAFFEQPCETVARQLLGKRLVHQEDGFRIAGLISETEAYSGSEDLASHARSGKTKRNRVMWETPGLIYMYFTYGMHWMLNIVCEPNGRAAAVLIRAVIPVEGIPQIRRRRRGQADALLTNGPGKLCQAFNLNDRFYGKNICQNKSGLWIEEAPWIPESAVSIGPRVGLNNVPEPWKTLPRRYRFQGEEVHQ